MKLFDLDQELQLHELNLQPSTYYGKNYATRLNVEAATNLKVAFGCGINNFGLFDGEEESQSPISGIMGLRPDNPISILNQLRPVFQDRFSYCIPSLFPIEADEPIEEAKEGTLDFGPQAVLTGDVQSTRLLGHSSPQLPSHYYLINVTGISVSGLAASLPAEGIFFGIDTIATYSAMQARYLKAIKDAVTVHFMDMYGMTPLNKTASGFELCYEIGDYGGRAEFLRRAPSVVMQLEGGAFLELKNTFQSFLDDVEGCLAINSLTYEYSGTVPILKSMSLSLVKVLTNNFEIIPNSFGFRTK